MTDNRRIGNRYRLVELIGQGGMGEVYRGEDERLDGRVVAIKKLALGSTRGLEKLKREGSFQAKVTDKRHVVDVYDLIEERDGVFIVMEFVEGGRSLESCIADGPAGASGAVTIARANELLLQAARGLDAVHKADVIHGDMKARNLLLTADGTLKLGDFGLSQAVGNVRTVQLGTAQNTAPEVYEGRVDPASDVYSLGFTFYEVYIGRDHFRRQFELQMTSSAVASWMRWHLDGTRGATPARELVGGVPSEVSDLLARMMDKRASERPTASEVLSGLEALRPQSTGLRPDDASTNTQPLAVPERPAEAPRSRVLPRLLGVAGAVVLVILTVEVFRQRSALARFDAYELRLKSLDDGLNSLGVEVEHKVAETEHRNGQAIEARTAAADQSAKSAVQTVSERISAVESRIGELGAKTSATNATLEKSTQSLTQLLLDSTKSLREDVDGLRNGPSAQPVDLAPLAARIAALEGAFGELRDARAKPEARAPPAIVTPPRATLPLSWAEVIEQDPDPKVVTNAEFRQRIKATGLPWRVSEKVSHIELLLVPAGTCFCGAGESDTEKTSKELPQQEVAISGHFYLGRYEVMYSEWNLVVPSSVQPDQLGMPMATLTPTELIVFMADTYALRLPTEAEWEYACRAGVTEPRYAPISICGWHSANAGSVVHPVGGRQANEFGFHDMLGNVWELCSALEGSSYVARGGSWQSSTRYCRASYRLPLDTNKPSSHGFPLGFRAARTP